MTWATGGDSQVELSLVDRCQPGEKVKGVPGGAPALRFQGTTASGQRRVWREDQGQTVQPLSC